MRRGFAVASVVFVIGVCRATSGATWYVDASVFVPGDGTSREKAFRTIQRGIDAASDGDMVIVAEGTYVENIKFNGTDIALTSTDPFHPAVVGKTMIDGGRRESVVRFAGTENETCVLSGFTIRNGWAKNGGGIYGGTPDSPTKATIRNNVITENRATKDWPDGNGGGIAYCDGLIEHNRILGNASRHGGGLYGCHGTIRNNVIVGNSAELNGGGLHACQGTVENNTIVRNGAEYGGGLHSCDGIIRNCIIWGNGGGNELIDCNSPRYCCIWLWTGGGEGNISQYPHFVDAACGDFHLESWSPCIDAGDPTCDFSNEPQPNGGRINMGAYGNTLEAACASHDSDRDGLPDEWELELLGSLAHSGTGDADSDGISNIEEYRRGLDPASSAMVWYVDAVARESGDGMMWETAFRTIQEGLDAADDGDTVLVSPGTYVENIEFSGEDVILRSSDPEDPLVVESTVIDGGKWGSVVGFFGTESESCVLAGFTIRNGSALCGGGIRGDGTRAAVRNNAIINNSVRWAGGGLYGCDGTVEGNTISHNYAFEGGGLAYCGAMVCDNSIIGNIVDAGGGGLYGCSGTIERNQIAENRAFDGGGLAVCDGSICHNTVTNNSAEANGGGLYGCNSAIRNNLVIANKAKVDGGGLYSCAGTVQNNTIYANSAEGDGGGLARCDGTVQNNVVTANSAKGDGGGLYSCGGAIESNTVYGNLAEGKGSGLYGCNRIILNCIIWGNRGGDQVAESSLPTYCSIENWTGGGEGNVAYYPYFVDSAHGDYHLQGRSPCIDAGDPSSPFFNEPDPNGGRIDLGAYGNTSEATSKSPDTDTDGLPDDWEIELFGDLAQGPNDDPDADLILNIDEYRRGLNPGAWHVDAQVVSSGDGRSWEKAFKTIQEGIDAASEGETVVVAQGTYVENIHFKGKNIVLQSTDPLEPGVVDNTIIDGNQSGSVVTFGGTENGACVLSGFTICNGSAESGGGIFGGPAYGAHTQAAICNNVIAGNSAPLGAGGLYGCDGPIENNTIINNSGRWGGMLSCRGLIRNNVICGNSADYDGGGLRECDGTIQKNLIAGNRARSGGGGLYFCRGIIQNNRITGNSAAYGGGLDDCDGTVENNTIANNSASRGGGLHDCSGTIRNCIIWGNEAWQVSGSSMPTYSCIQNWGGGGEGNIALAPYFVASQAEDYHLKSWSPCIDAGDPSSPFSKEPQPNGGRIDMGAYGNTPEATSKSRDTDSDGLPDDWEREFLGNLLHGPEDDPDGDLVPNLEEYRRGTDPLLAAGTWYVDASVPESGDGTTWQTAFKTIQRGIDEASEEGVVMVAPGTYVENIQFKGKNVLLRSIDPHDPAVVAATIIDGNQAGSVVTFEGTEDHTCILSGFTVRNGSGAGGGGGIDGNGTHATISNNVVTANAAYEEWGGEAGAGLCDCDGTIEYNSISGNVASGFFGGTGGGLSGCDGIIQNNTITGNSAGYGAGLSWCNGTIQNNTITGNSASSGGGLYQCSGMIENNTIFGNWARYYGGGLYQCSGMIENNMIAGNSARYYGGGLYWCSGMIENNTIFGNSADQYGGGLYDCTAALRNCIIWGNTAPDGPQLYSSSVPTYSCIDGGAAGGEGNISYYPYFVDAPGGDYHLRSWSPCIDAGDPNSDFSNEPQPNGGRIDMGAYGNTTEATSASPDSDEDSLPDDWEKAFFGDLAQGPEDNPDGDSLSNIEEYRRGSDPTLLSGTWYVDSSVAAGDGTSWETAFKTIQEGIDAASEGDVVFVGEGTYFENIQFRGKNVALTSTDPLNPEVVAKTVIDGGANGSVVSFAGAENEMCILSGFTIRNGRADHGGGIAGRHTRATIQSNVIVANFASAAGAGLFECDGTIRYNTIRENSTNGNGGGLANCLGTIKNNAVARNLAYPSGGGLYECDGTIENNSVVGNSAFNGGGGLSFCGGKISNCIIWENIALSGDQLYECSQPTYCCVQGWEWGVANISSYPHFVALHAGDYHLRSWSPCIDAGDPTSDFSNEPQPNGGRINMGAYGNTPEAASASPDSDDDSLPDDWEKAFFGDLAQGPEDNPDGDSLSNIEEYRRGSDPTLLSGTWYVDSSVAAPGDGTSWETAFKTIQQGIDAAWDGGTVIVAEGTYHENVRFRRAIPKGQTIFYEGFDAYTNLYTNLDVSNAGWTVVNGSGEPQVAWRLWSTTGQPLVNQEPNIEGMVGNYMISDSDLSPEAIMDEELITPEIDCTDWVQVRLHFNKNYRIYDDPDHRQVAEVDVRRYEEDIGTWGDWVNLLHYDYMTLAAGEYVMAAPEAVDLSAHDGRKIQVRWHFYEAVWDYWFAIDEITVSGEPAGALSLWHSDGPSTDTKKITLTSKDPSNALTIANTIIDGGGSGPVVTFEIRQKDACVLSGFTIRNGTTGIRAAGTYPTIQNNTITANSGSGVSGCNGTIESNTITANSWDGLRACNGTIENNVVAGNSGGGLFCDGTIENNTIVGNSGGLRYCNGTVRNCIIWGNGSQLYESSVPRYSCIEGWAGEGEGNIGDDPRLVDADNGDFRLLPSSPCIDAGENLSWGLLGTDIVGRRRLMHGGKTLAMDMGAYEYYINDLSFGRGADGATLSWSSVLFSTYSIFYSEDLLTWHLAEDNVPSTGVETTFWIDDGSKTGVAPSVATRRFYRVLENPQ